MNLDKLLPHYIKVSSVFILLTLYTLTHLQYVPIISVFFLSISANKSWKQCTEILKRDRLYKDAIKCTIESEEQEIVEGLLIWLLDCEAYDYFSSYLHQVYFLLFIYYFMF